ncbi:MULTISPECIES: BglG family transcription antiterminator LicT [unclassified Vagococcus]|uniref:BglG family transcription antiterminator LicT n=1 Tax=unclassified Vagococcus TaxID=2648499 RepID=UPI001F50D03B|nr:MULTISPECIES: PRD domain-containing protein [unclassified Vagococcus]MCI0130499.1 PRD domain-containing protein [Vagococcus sp. CY53-2]UNM89930.1 PRD domain-containing protein [Vagococcus sp. CY52-2]
MIIKKILNNNVVISDNKESQEVVVMGKGIAFNKKVGDKISLIAIDKMFVNHSGSERQEMEKLVEKIPPDIIEVSKEIMLLAEKEIGYNYSEKSYLSLTDHLFYAIERAREKISLPNPLLFDIKKFYPKEFKVALKAVEIVKDKLNADMTEEEAGVIALHLANSVTDYQDMATTMKNTEIVKNILNIVRRYVGYEFDEHSTNYQRMVTHIQFFVQRIINNELSEETDDFLYELVQSKYPKAFQCSLRVKDYLLTKYDVPINQSEIIYLTIHINKVMDDNKG